jgi:hypothetical protein
MTEPYDDGKTDELIASTNNSLMDDFIRYGRADEYPTAQEAADAAMAESSEADDIVIEGDEIFVVDDDGTEHPVDEDEAIGLLNQWQAEDQFAEGKPDAMLRYMAQFGPGGGDATAEFYDRTLHELGYDRLAEAAQAEVDAETAEPGEP